jgi:hypothetical protein
MGASHLLRFFDLPGDRAILASHWLWTEQVEDRDKTQP